MCAIGYPCPSQADINFLTQNKWVGWAIVAGVVGMVTVILKRLKD